MDGIFCKEEPQLLVCRIPGYSFFFDCIRSLWSGDKFHPIHRICSLMRKLGVTHLSREELNIDGELMQEHVDLEDHLDADVDFKATRISFFRCANQVDLHWKQLRDNDLLGYMVIATFRWSDKSPQSYVFEAVVRPPTLWRDSLEGQPVSNYYVRGQQDFQTVVGSVQEHLSLKLRGSFFCQQNGITHVCAHAALRTAVNSSPIHTGSKVTSHRINESLKRHGAKHPPAVIDGREVGRVGLTPNEIEKVAGDLGFIAHIADFVARPSIDYEDFIYPFVESGFPTILGLNPSSVAHVVAVVGHTLNSDRWLPDARRGYSILPYEAYTSVAAWTDHFVVSDDNLGALVTLPTESVRNILVPKHNAGLHVSVAIGLVPQHITVPGYSVERRASNLIPVLLDESSRVSSTPNRWIEYVMDAPATVPRVLRTTLQNRDDYLRALFEAEDELGNKLTKDDLDFVGSKITGASILGDRIYPFKSLHRQQTQIR